MHGLKIFSNYFMPKNHKINLNNFILDNLQYFMEKDDALFWSKENFLSWSDFQADSNPSAFEDASSKIKFHFTWTVDSEMKTGKVYYEIKNIHLSTYFLRHLSWVRRGQNSPNLLKHEQGHFDLAELSRIDIEEKIQNSFYNKKFLTRGKNEEEQKQFAREDSGMMISKELEKWNQYLSQKREEYGRNTEFGLNLKSQQEYNTKFDELRKKISLSEQ